MNDDDVDRSGSLRRRAARSLLDGASRLVSRARLRAMNLAEAGEPAVARGADHLLLEAQTATYRELHRRFTERAERGEAGLPSALDALDAMWENIRQLRGGAPAVLLTLSTDDATVLGRRERFYRESTALLEDAIRTVFAEDLGHLALPPDRIAVLVRVVLEGLVVELAQARTMEEVRVVDQAYGDLRTLFERFVLTEDQPPAPPLDLAPIPLPW